MAAEKTIHPLAAKEVRQCRCVTPREVYSNVALRPTDHETSSAVRSSRVSSAPASISPFRRSTQYAFGPPRVRLLIVVPDTTAKADRTSGPPRGTMSKEGTCVWPDNNTAAPV